MHFDLMRGHLSTFDTLKNSGQYPVILDQIQNYKRSTHLSKCN